MSTLRKFFGRSDDSVPDEASVVSTPTRSWNTVSTLGVGAVADIDERGAIFSRTRPVAVEIWFGSGNRWVRGTSADGARQTRVAGLPIIETRQRLGDGDVVMTAWADEAGDARGRVVVSLSNETDVSVVAAVVVRPYGLLGDGSIKTVRVSDSLVVVDRAPLVDLGRTPGDTVAAIDRDRSEPSLLDGLKLGDGEIVGHEEFEDPGGRASFAALIPLTASAAREIQIVDGREASTVAPAPLENVVSGWRSHLANAAEYELPGWPKHVPAALMSGLLGAVEDQRRPLGDEIWRVEDDALLVAALGGAGLDWAAATIAGRLLERVEEGTFDRDAWPALGAALIRIAGTESGDSTLGKHGEAVAAVVGHSLSQARTEASTPMLLRVMYAAHGAKAAADASLLSGTMRNESDGVALARHGLPVPAQSASLVADTLHRRSQQTAELIGLGMVALGSMSRPFEPIVPTRSLAGSTWRWPRDGSGDSPHARAALLIGLRAMCVTEYPGTTGAATITHESPIDLDIFPGTSKRWLGQNMSFSRVPTAAGTLSAAIRWHGPRPALLWEITNQRAPFELGCYRLDPSFRTSEPSGEALLAEPALADNDGPNP